MSDRHREAGFVAVELVMAIGLLLLPVVLLVSSLPQWSERQHATVVAADAAARVAAQAWPNDGSVAAEQTVDETVANYGIEPSDVRVAVAPPPARGDLLTVTVTIRMPALAVPLLARTGSWSWTAREAVRIDDYRSR